MPEGIVPELLIVAALLAVLAGAVFVSVRSRRREVPPAEAPPAVEEPLIVEEPPTVQELPTVEVPASVETVPPEEPVPIVAERVSLRERLAKTRRFFTDRLVDALGGGTDEDTWDDVQAVLIQADIGVGLADRITEALKNRARERRTTDPDQIRALLADELVSLFDTELERALVFAPEGPSVWLVVGVNGTGKTTTIGKLASDLTGRGRSVALAAADTFRAAADEQLAVWAERSGSSLVKHQPGADPAAVAYDALQHARAKQLDVLIVDTAGRLHTKTPLMDELGKVRRVIEKEGKVNEALLVIDASAGQNGLVQAKEFAAAAGVTGVVLTKLDGTAKGGIALAIEDTLGIPIKLIGVGEGIEDLEPFDPKTFVDALLA